jgi:putative flippase GtrA
VTFVRYVAVQLVAYGIDMGVFLATLSSGLAGPVLANVPAKITAGLVAFFLHRHFTFRSAHTADARRQAIQYFALLALNVPLSSAVLAVVLVPIHHPVFAKFVADVLCVFVTFWASKLWVFKGRNASATPPQAGRPP